MKKKEWELPLRTNEYQTIDLAKRVKFESNKIIRFLTPNNRDILFELDEDGKQVRNISEV